MPWNLLGPVVGPSKGAGVTPPVQPRRQMTPEEIAALWGEPGAQPTLPPMSVADLVMLGLSGPAQDAGLPPTLLQMVRYKRPGVSTLAREAAEAYHARPRVDPIAAKNRVFHATDAEAVDEILRGGEIVPDPQLLVKQGAADWAAAKQREKGTWRPPNTYTPNPGAWRGVSVSRVPRVASKGEKAVSFVIDPEKIGPTRPFVEEGYGKTRSAKYDLYDLPDPAVDQLEQIEAQMGEAMQAEDWGSWNRLRAEWQSLQDHFKGQLPERVPNSRFEFEDRTFDTSIPRKAIKELWVDKEALAEKPGYDRFGARMTPEDRLDALRYWADEYGLPYREFPSGLEMHSARAGMSLSDLAKRKRK